MVEKTVNLFLSVGSVILMHYDSETLQHDVERIRELGENSTMFVFDLEAGTVVTLNEPFNINEVMITGDRPC